MAVVLLLEIRKRGGDKLEAGRIVKEKEENFSSNQPERNASDAKKVSGAIQ